MILHNHFKPIRASAMRIAFMVLILFLGLGGWAQSYDLRFENGLKTKVTILENSPAKLPKGCLSIYPALLGLHGERGFYGPYSLGLGYWRWDESRRHLFEANLAITPRDTRSKYVYDAKPTPNCNARLDYRYAFFRKETVRTRKLAFLAGEDKSYSAGIVYVAPMDVRHGRLVTVRAGLNGQMFPFNAEGPNDTPENWYRVERSLNSFGHIGLSTLRTFYLAYSSERFGIKQQRSDVHEFYADFLFGLGVQAYGSRFSGNPYQPESVFEVLPHFKTVHQVVRVGARAGATFRTTLARKARFGSLYGIELGRNPGFLGSNLYAEVKFGFIWMGRSRKLL